MADTWKKRERRLRGLFIGAIGCLLLAFPVGILWGSFAALFVGLGSCVASAIGLLLLAWSDAS
jgi:hypothetical protein